jgi:hypothetical protein
MQDLVEDLRRGSEGVDRQDAFCRVIPEHLGRVSLVKLQPVANDVFIGIIRTALLGCALAKPLHHLFYIITNQVENFDDRDVRL